MYILFQHMARQCYHSTQSATLVNANMWSATKYLNIILILYCNLSCVCRTNDNCEPRITIFLWLSALTRCFSLPRLDVMILVKNFLQYVWNYECSETISYIEIYIQMHGLICIAKPYWKKFHKLFYTFIYEEGFGVVYIFGKPQSIPLHVTCTLKKAHYIISINIC